MNSEQEIIYAIALSKLNGIGIINANLIYQAFGNATSVFEHRNDIRSVIPDASDRIVNIFRDVDYALKEAEREMQFIHGKSVTCLTQSDPAYPHRLMSCPDAPLVLFYCGNADLNKAKVVSMVGTRKITPYGADLCKTFIADLQRICPDVMIVSGLAYGVDIHSHRAALANGMDTVGVLAHGLDRIYPFPHRQTAVEMTRQGGLLTEYTSGTAPERYNFVGRNRIVAGMCDQCIIVESAAKGGSLITANLAFGYNRSVFAFPGRTTDKYSAGCNKLIQQQKASIINSADDFIELCGWSDISSASSRPQQQELFLDLTEGERAIVDVMRGYDDLSVNDITNRVGYAYFKTSAMLFDLEMKCVVSAIGGGRYRLTRGNF